MAISHSSTGNHILSKAWLAVCLAAGQSNSKTLIYHIRKIKRLLFVCSPLLSWGRVQTASYLWSCTYQLATSSLLLHELLCCMEVFFSLSFLISSPWWPTPTPLQGKSMIIFMPKPILLESFPGLSCFIFMEQLYLYAQCKIIIFYLSSFLMKSCVSFPNVFNLKILCLLPEKIFWTTDIYRITVS